MYVCICKGITEEQINRAQNSGGSFEEVCRQLGVGSDCGVCLLSQISNSGKSQHQKSCNSRPQKDKSKT